ncbi:Pyrophosphate-energized vacuolar membrane proton pump [Capsicum baccatum]|uniref:H(+)-exporting diphosphatase n=1 Tax=Capsicum baccatum TaxID=33114 RepID=A0A2G2VTX2_CAPBA|nr:Pyrophosphate-energized vacuolar membrane proton pump [Capsicum baccatum]
MSGCSSMLESHNFSKYVAPAWVDEPNRQLYCDMPSRDLTCTLRLSFDSIEFGDVADASHRPMDVTEIPTRKNNRKSKHCVDPIAAITRRDNRDKDDFTHGEHRPRASIRHGSYGTGVMGLQFKHLSALLAWAMLPYWFSAMTMKNVGSAALKMAKEVRRQFNDIPGLMEGTTYATLSGFFPA